MKKIIAILLSLTLVLAAGCSQKNTQPATDKPNESKPAEETQSTDVKATDVEFWTFQDLHVEYYQKMADNWNAAHPDKPINLIPTVYPFDDMHSKHLWHCNPEQEHLIWLISKLVSMQTS
jgi:arabinosaccharide transport system substrate-binding protein